MYQTCSVVAAVALVAAVAPSVANAGDEIQVQLVDHVTAGFIEQDVYVERQPGSGEVWRINADERDAWADAMVYRTAEPQHHDPMNPMSNGPYAAGEDLGFTMDQWLSASGTATYACDGETARLNATFEGLVPDAVYTLWAFYMPMPATQPFSTYDLPVGDRDGSQSIFMTDASGAATYSATFAGCLQMTGPQLASGLAVNFHSDGNTYGPAPGDFGTNAHIQLFGLLPAQETVVARN